MRRLTLAVAALIAVLVPITTADAYAACANADKHPAEASVTELRSATLCLVNSERRERGRAALRSNAGLALAGQRHARDMVSKRYFAHDSRSGSDFKQRILRTDYVRAGHSAILGENLAWGSHEEATPRSIVRAWMASPGHRANVLQSTFREIGIGIVRASPRGSNRAATYAAEFGRRY
jgi:uncharacterized protein YkwD